MTLLPIQFRNKIKYNECEKLTKSEVLDEIENYLEEENFNYIIRKNNKIIFHKADAWTSFSTKSFLVSGIVKIKEKNDGFEIINGNWMVFLIALPLIFTLLIIDSEFSTLDGIDIKIIKYFFAIAFGVNLVVRFFAHLSFKSKIKELIKSYAQ